MQTSGTFTQDQAFPDAQIVVSATDFQPAGATPSSGNTAFAGVGVPTIFGTVTGTFTATANISKLLFRTGVFAPSTAQTLSGQAFGTAAGLPGPSAVTGTSGPDGFGTSSIKPPVLKANLPTLIGSVSGPKKKGVQINWVDFLYYPGATTPSSSVTGSLVQLQMPLGTGTTPVLVSTLFGSTALPTTVQTAGKVTRARVPVTTPVMLTQDGSLLILTFSNAIAAGVGLTFAGAILGVSYNFN
jgi:hypothetical protein